jgi:hypothetical protein
MIPLDILAIVSLLYRNDDMTPHESSLLFALFLLQKLSM